MKREVLKGHLDLLLLAAVASGAAHGYAIIKALASRSEGVFNLPEGTLYPALHRLETAELLASSWAMVGGRRRRVYEITEAGRAALAREREQWSSFAQAVESVIETP